MRGASRLAGLANALRVVRFRLLSDCRRVSGSPVRLQPVLICGRGRVVIGHGVVFGWPTSGGFRGGYCHIEAASNDSTVEIGDGAWINNNAVIKSEGPGIRIAAGALIGSGVRIYDSDFHDLTPGRRHDGSPRMGAVEIGEGSFIGDAVIVLKGVRIGANSVIGAGSVVTRSIPANAVAAGNPARVVRSLAQPPAPRAQGQGADSCNSPPASAAHRAAAPGPAPVGCGGIA
ncbi:MAG TPA: acyltransferase [Solirubrobacteraceae bacterium]|nr:acyltransferase [Solirubrobacteraceae bacterium]